MGVTALAPGDVVRGNCRFPVRLASAVTEPLAAGSGLAMNLGFPSGWGLDSETQRLRLPECRPDTSGVWSGLQLFHLRIFARP